MVVVASILVTRFPRKTRGSLQAVTLLVAGNGLAGGNELHIGAGVDMADHVLQHGHAGRTADHIRHSEARRKR